MSPQISGGKEKLAVGDIEISRQQQQQEQQETDLDHASTTTNESDDEYDLDGRPQNPDVLLRDRDFRESPFRLASSKLSPKVNPILREANEFEIDAPQPRSAIDGNSTNASPEICSEKNEFSLSDNLESAEAVPKSRGRLGRIGGKPKPEVRRELKDKVMGERPTVFDGTIRATSVDIGGKKEEQVPTDIGSATVGRGLTSPKDPVNRRETSQERADNKREQLKRQLENKSNAMVKKKRKF